MPLATTWIDLEIIILSEINQRKTMYDITHMRNLKYDTNEFINKTEIDSWTQKTNQKENSKTERKSGIWDEQIQTTANQFNIRRISSVRCYSVSWFLTKNSQSEKLSCAPLLPT